VDSEALDSVVEEDSEVLDSVEEDSVVLEDLDSEAEALAVVAAVG
jgi:hypothetical protein